MMEEWRGSQGHPEFPDGPIQPPCSKEELMGYFSLDNVAPRHLEPGTTSGDQLSSLVTYLKDAPLTKKAKPHTSSTSGMASQQATTIATKKKTISQFLGFCLSHLHLSPTLEHIMRPTLVAKFIGFHEAKGSKPSTIKRVVDQLASLTPFVSSPRFCPCVPQFPQSFISQVDDWYTNLCGKANSKAIRHYKKLAPPAKDVTLWQIMEGAKAKWNAFVASYQVGTLHGDMPWGACPCITSPTPPLPPRPRGAGGPGSWSRSASLLAWPCTSQGLASPLSGRVGSESCTPTSPGPAVHMRSACEGWGLGHALGAGIPLGHGHAWLTWPSTHHHSSSSHTGMMHAHSTRPSLRPMMSMASTAS